MGSRASSGWVSSVHADLCQELFTWLEDRQTYLEHFEGDHFKCSHDALISRDSGKLHTLSHCFQDRVGADIFGESEVHEDHVGRDAGGPTISFDFVGLRDTFRVRAHVMKTPPGFLKGPYRCALRLGMREASTTSSNRS